jgi:hypothetical protein
VAWSVAFSAVGFDNRRKRSILIIAVIIASAASADFLALGRRLVVLAHPALDWADGFQFPRCVVPSAFDRCAFIEIQLLGVIGPEQVFPGEELVCPENAIPAARSRAGLARLSRILPT